MTRQPVAGRLISDADIDLEPMHLRGVFKVTPEIGDSGRRGMLQYRVESFHPASIDNLWQVAKEFAKQHHGTISPRLKKIAPMEFTISFDAPPRHQTYADQFVHLAGEVFLELREAFGVWQVTDSFTRSVMDGRTFGTKLRVVTKRTTRPGYPG